jgi:hypothetical protein
MKTTPLTPEQLTAAALSFVGNFEPTRIPRAELTQMFAAFLAPLTHDGLSMACVGKLIDAANDVYEAEKYGIDPMEAMDEKGGTWAHHAKKAERRVAVISASICDGGRPE